MELVLIILAFKAILLMISLGASIAEKMLLAQLTMGICIFLEFLTILCLIVYAVSKLVGGA